MESFESRMQSAEQLRNRLIAQSIEQPFEQAIELWKAGYSTRIIQEITGIHRSKISRYVNENDLERDDDKRTQNRKNRVYQASKLYKMGFSRDEIATEMQINPRTVDSYLKEIGAKEKTKIQDLQVSMPDVSVSCDSDAETVKNTVLNAIKSTKERRK